MSDTKRISVKQKHIEESMKNNSNHCMVADSIRDAFPGAQRVVVDTQTIRFTKDGVRRTYLTPPSVQTRIINFDMGYKVDPFRFNLKDPIHTRKAGKIRPKEAPVVTEERHTSTSRPKVTVERREGNSPPVSMHSAVRQFGSKNLRMSQVLTGPVEQAN